MKDFNGTKGNWHVRKTADNCYSVKSDETMLIIADLIIDRDKEIGHDEQMYTAKLNATLMAKSPELLEVLQELVKAHRDDNTKVYGILCEHAESLINSITL